LFFRIIPKDTASRSPTLLLRRKTYLKVSLSLKPRNELKMTLKQHFKINMVHNTVPKLHKTGHPNKPKGI